MSVAYTPTETDEERVDAAEEHIDDMFPSQLEKLIELYDRLDQVSLQMRLVAGERGAYLAHTLKEKMKRKIFAQSDICTAYHAQYGDTVEVHFSVYSDKQEYLKQTIRPYVFNPGERHTRRSLEK